MYRSILVPVDGSTFGEQAIPFAAAAARRAGAVLHLAHVHVPLIAPSGIETAAFQGPWIDITKQDERDYLQSLSARVARATQVRVESSLIDGVVASALAEHARRCAAGLVVMSTHARAGLRRLWHRGVADQITRELPLPVLLVHASEQPAEPDLAREPEVRHIVVPLDGSAHAEGMLQHAEALGRCFGARYTLLRVVLRKAAARSTSRERLGPRLEDRERAEASRYLAACAERLRAPGRDVRIAVVTADDAATGILGYVRARAADPHRAVHLVAMECHPHRTVSRYLGSHTADAVQQGATVPVLLYQPALRPRQGRGLETPLDIRA